MDWLEQNIDAYRIVSEILGELRLTIRQVLENVYGDEWYRTGLPEEVFERLVNAKEREKSIDWYEGQYQQIMDYATFPDLIAVLEMNAEHFPDFVNLAPSPALLQARFMELDVMRAKLGRARPISETELSFLGTFHLRFRKASDDARRDAKGSESSPPSSDPQQDSAAGATEIPVEDDDQAVSEAPAAAEPEKVSPPRRPVQTNADSQPPSSTPRTGSDATGEDDIPTREIPVEDDSSGGSESEDPVVVDDGDEAAAAGKSAGGASTTVGPKKLREALETNDHQTVLRELYREVTAIAEGVWSSDVTPAPLVWDQVTASDWYEMNFSRLGLQSLSVFYEITSKVEKKMRAGTDRKELQEFLKETNFAKTLLSLRDMFKANGI